MKSKASADWTLERLKGKTTSAAFRDPATRDWSVGRAAMHEQVINHLLAEKRAKENPKLWVVGGGVGSGKSTLITSQLAPEHADAVVIDVDQLWLKIPEYAALARQDWKTAGDRTYVEVRYLRDAAFAEAAARKLDIILEVLGDEDSAEAAMILKRDGYEISFNYADCPVEEARKRMNQRANTNPTPEDNLWCSPQRADFPDKFDYQNVELKTFVMEYEKRLKMHKVCPNGKTREN